MTAEGVLFTDVRLLDPGTGRDESGWLAVQLGGIADLGSGSPPTAFAEFKRVSGAGAVLAPALIDLTVIADDQFTAAAAGGVGTVLAREGAPAATAAARRLIARDAAPDPERRRALADIAAPGADVLTLGPTTLPAARLARDLYRVAARTGRPLIVRPVEPSFADGIVHDSPFGWRLGLPPSPAIGEALAIARDGALAAEAGARVVFTGVSSAAGLAALREVRRRAGATGARLSAAVPIANLVFNEVDLGDLDPRYRLDPPLRSEDDREALIAAVEAGEATVVSGHAPVHDERLPFAAAPAGGATLPLLLPALLRFVHEGRWSLAEALAPVTISPARLLGLPQGRLAPGSPADLVLFDPDAPFKCDPARLPGGPSRTPFAGRLLQGAVLWTMVGGEFTTAPPGARPTC